MPFGSRQKGSKGELEVARFMERWWGEVEPGCKFARTPGSGGWSTANNRADFGTAGDLVTTAVTYPFSIEVKRREKGWTWKNALAGKPTALWAWWRQAQAAADEMHKEPLLIFRKNREAWRVLLPLDYLHRCGLVASMEAHGASYDGISYDAEGHAGFAEFAAHWSHAHLRGVDFGSRMPVCLLWEDMATMPPRAFILPAKTGVRATGTRNV